MAVLLMGVIKKTSLRHYWSTDPLLQTPFFGTLFSQDRFLLLLRCLHFTNSARVSHHDPLHKIRRIFTAITSSFRRVFVPYKDLCVDESLMKWKGRLAFRQYIPTKRSRFGVKFFILCDVLTRCVMTLLAPYLGKGSVLYVDNWYSSPSLFQHLLSHGTGACGTVRANRKGMPVFTGKMVKGQVECRQNRTPLVVKWHDVLMLTTVHFSMMSATGKVDHVTSERKVKPHCVIEYNKKMGAVDRADMVKGFLECASVSPLSCVMCPHLMFPYLVCFLSLFNVIIS